MGDNGGVEITVGDSMKRQSEFISYRRILELDKLLSLGGFPSTAELAEKLEVSGVSIKRDIDRLRLFFSAPISYSKLYEGWYYENPVFRLPAQFVNDKQLIAAALTRKMMESLHGTIAHDAAKELLEELTNTVDNPLSIHTTVDTKWVDSRIVFLEDEYEAVNPEIWKTISECLRYNYELEFMYKGLLYKEHVLRRVRPYQLLYSRSAWTLWGYDVTPRKILLFRLNRMKNVTTNKKKFRLPDDFDYREKSTGNCGIWVSDNRYAFSILYYGIDASLALERIWAKDQKIQQHADGSVTVTFTSGQFEPVLSHVLSCGVNAVPQKPEKLVQAWKDTICTLYSRSIK